MSTLHPVILCGGSGTRLWPRSRSTHPKQFIDLAGHTLFGDTLTRCQSLGDGLQYIVACNEMHRFFVANDLRAHGLRAAILLEPVGRDTAPAIALAAFQALEQANHPSKEIMSAEQDEAKNAPPILLILPSDQYIQPPEIFAQAVRGALPYAEAGRLVTFGIIPTAPATEYGYIIFDEAQGDQKVFSVKHFQEKPDSTTAKNLLDAGNCVWNSGIFLLRADVYIQELRQHAPSIFTTAMEAWKKRKQDGMFVRLDKSLFSACPANSIDYAVMEHTDKTVVMPLDIQWKDLGSWEAFYTITPKDTDNNACTGDVIMKDSRNCYVQSTQRLVAALGLDDIAVVETRDAVLVTRLDHTQQVKEIVNVLKEHNRPESELHPLIYRPWGSYEGLAVGNRFQVKRIIVNPGAQLSLQKHHHRAEHWVVVAGTAEVCVNGEVRLITENESVYIPLGAVHRLKNPGILPLILIEIQSGSYLKEDDIIRLEDNYGRT